MHNLRVAVLFHSLGPYHHARLRAGARYGQITAIEFYEQDHTYKWNTVSGAEGFERLTLFRYKTEINSCAAIMQKMNKVLDHVQPDVVALPGWGSKESLVALDWCLRSHLPNILMSESTSLDAARKGWVEKIKQQIVQFYTTGLVGGSASAKYLEMLGFQSGRIFWGYDVVENDHFNLGAAAARHDDVSMRSRLGLPKRFFLASGRFVAKKNFARLIQAYSRYVTTAGSNACELVLLGDGPLRKPISALIKGLGLTGKVLMCGFRQYGELPYYYGLAEAFIHPSTSEQWGLVVNEAMAAGLPILVSNRCGCAADLVREGVNGFAFDPYDVEKLAALMLQIGSGALNRKAMGEASQEIIALWSPQTFATNLWKAAELAHCSALPEASYFRRLLLKVLACRNYEKVRDEVADMLNYRASGRVGCNVSSPNHR